MVGDNADAFLWITAVIDEDTHKQAAWLPLSNSDGQVLIELGKAAGLQNVGQHIRSDFGGPIA